MSKDKKQDVWEKTFDEAVEKAKQLADQVEQRALNVDKMPKREDIK